MGFTPAAVASIAIAAVGTGASIYASQQAADAEKHQQEEAAQIAQEQAALQINSNNQQMQRTISQQRALFGAAGVDPNSGTPEDVQGTTAGLTGEANFNTQFGGNVQSDVDRQNARTAEINGLSRSGAAVFNFGASTLARGGSSSTGGGVTSVTSDGGTTIGSAGAS